MRIVQLVPSFVVGGAETFVTQLAQAQLDLGHDVHIVCVREKGPLFERLSPEMQARVTVVGKSSRWDVTVLPRLRRCLQTLRPEVLHTHLFTSLSWGAVAARMASVPLIVHTQHAAHRDEYAYLPWVRRQLGRFVHQIVACSKGVEEVVRAQKFTSQERICTIENGIPLKGRARASLNGEPFTIGTVGRQVPVKGQTYLLQAVASLVEAGRSCRLVLAGDGPLRQELENEAAQLGLNDHVEFLGSVSNISECLAQWDVFVLPSLSEGLPISLLEAGAAGLPLVVTSGGGARIVLDRGAGGWVVPPADPQALSEVIGALMELTGAERGALGDASFQLVHNTYGMNACAERYMDLYQKLLGR